MVYFFNDNNNDQHDLFELPPRALQYEDFQNYYGDQPAQKSESFTRPNCSEHIPPTASISNLQWPSDESSSLDSFPTITGISPLSYPTSQSLYASQSDLYHAPNVSSQPTHPPPVAPPTEIDYSFLANVDPTLLNADILNSLAMSGSVSYTPESVGNSSPSRKRPLPTEPDNASIDAFSTYKRRRVNNNSQSVANVSYPANVYNNNNNLTTNHPNESLTLPASISRPNATPSSSPYPNPQNNYDASSYSLPALPAPTLYNTMGGTQSSPAASYRTLVNDTTWWDPNAQLNPPTPNFVPASSTVVVPTAAYSSEIQLSSDDYPEYDEGTANYTLDLGFSADENGDLYNGTSSLPYSTSPPDLENAPFYWNTDVPDIDNFYNTTSIASVASGSNVVPPPMANPIHEEVDHRNAVVNNTTDSSVIDFRQHSDTANQISTTGNVANAITPDVSVPSTSGAPNVDPLAITYEITAPSPSSSPTLSAIPKKKRSRRFESKPAVDQWMWYYKDDLFHCRYTGPDRPKGCAYSEAGPQVFKTDSTRNFERHIRRHAKAEASMRDLSQHERVAMNALAAAGKLRVPARCDLEHENLAHCDFYRRNGRRWAAMTMERAENLERKHRQKYHDVGWKEKRPPQPRPPPCPQPSKKQSKQKKA